MLTIDQNGNLIQGITFPEAIQNNTVAFKRGSSSPIPIQWVVPFGSPVEIDPPGNAITAFKFGVKQNNQFEQPYVVSNYVGGNWVYAKTGGSTFTDAVTNSTTLLTSATAGFMASDVGLPIAGAGIPAGATIASVLSATNILLSVAATATAGGVTIVITGRQTTYTVSPVFDTAKLDNLLGYDPNGFQETVYITCEADEGGGLAGKYFDLADANGPVRVWFYVGGVGAAPAAPAGGRLLEVAFAENATANTIATAIATALAADAQFTPSTSASAQVTSVATNVGPVAAPDAGNCGFAVLEWLVGSLPDTLDQQPSVTLMGEIRVILANGTLTSITFLVVVYNDVNKGTEGQPPSPNPAWPNPSQIVTLTGMTGLPGADPHVAGSLWNNGGVLCVSAG